MPKINGVYYNGKVTAGQQVELVLEPDELVFTNLAGTNGDNHSWHISKIHNNDFNDPDMAVLQYGNFPAEVLEVSDPEFIEILRNRYKNAPFVKPKYGFLQKHKGIGLGLLTVVFIALMAGVYFFVLPKVSEAAAVALPYSVEKQLGDAISNSFLVHEQIDSSKSVYAQRFFNNLNKNPEQDIRVTVVESGITNAYALPGGHIVVYSPMIDNSDSYEEFAGLLAHENAHLQQRHSLRALFRNLSGYLLLSLVFSDVNGMMAVIVENAGSIHSLQFNRELEQEADMEGLELLYDRGVDPEGMVKLFDKLRENKGDSQLPEFMSTHPLLDARMAYLNKEIAKREFTAQQNDSLKYYWQLLKQD